MTLGAEDSSIADLFQGESSLLRRVSASSVASQQLSLVEVDEQGNPSSDHGVIMEDGESYNNLRNF